MKFKLNKSLFSLLIDVPEVDQYIDNITKVDDYVEFNMNSDNFREVQLLINDEIVLNGMNNQETVNELGIKLYKLYDEVSYQKNNNEGVKK